MKIGLGAGAEVELSVRLCFALRFKKTQTNFERLKLVGKTILLGQIK